MKQTIRLTESELRGMIQEAVEDAMDQNDVDEGLWNQMKTSAKTFFNKKRRWVQKPLGCSEEKLSDARTDGSNGQP